MVQIHYKIIIKTQDGTFTYNTENYVIDDFFIRFTDDRNNLRMIPKTDIIQVVGNE